MQDLIQIANQFDIHQTVRSVEPLGNGLINQTFKVFIDGNNEPQYVLQRINSDVFKDVDMLQHNIETVTHHIRQKLLERNELDIRRKVLQFLPTRSGKQYFFDGSHYWRMMYYIADSVTYQSVTPQYARLAGEKFGTFESMLADLHEPLGEIIPDFHNIELRIRQLEDAVQNDTKGRVHEVQYYIDEIRKRQGKMSLGEQLHREGKLPKRICHCDTKVNNMLFDVNGDFLCVIDLDTVMPSFVFSDYGDFLRTAANTSAEDDPVLDNIDFNMEIFAAFTEGFLCGTKDFLLPIERDNLPYAAQLFPYMQAVRFLTDYLNGDTYYKIEYPEHNLVRTRAQWKLFECSEKKEQEMLDWLKNANYNAPQISDQRLT